MNHPNEGSVPVAGETVWPAEKSWAALELQEKLLSANE